MVLQLLPSRGVHQALDILLQLLRHQEWEARHGGLLGLKYLLAVREVIYQWKYCHSICDMRFCLLLIVQFLFIFKDLLGELLPKSYPHIVQGLADSVDDVGAVAASALIPVAETVVNLMGNRVDETIQQLWDLLEDQDELAAACNSFMGLLAALLSVPKCQTFLRYACHIVLI